MVSGLFRTMHPSGSTIPCPLPENRKFPASLSDRTGRVVISQPFYKLMAGADEMPDSLLLYGKEL